MCSTCIVCTISNHLSFTSPADDATGDGSRDPGNRKRQCRRRRGKKRRVSVHNRCNTHKETKNLSCQSEAEPDVDGGKKTEGQKEEVVQEEEEGGQDMLSHVYSDSEEAVRRSLFHATHVVFGCGADGSSSTVDDGLYSPPDTTCETVIIPVSCNQVY